MSIEIKVKIKINLILTLPEKARPLASCTPEQVAEHGGSAEYQRI